MSPFEYIIIKYCSLFKRNFLSSVASFFGDILDTRRAVNRVSDVKVESHDHCTIKTKSKPISREVKKKEKKEKKEKKDIKKFNSRDDAVDYYLKLLGEDEGCTLLSVGSGGHQISYNCEGCDDFRLRVSLKNRNSVKKPQYWSLQKGHYPHHQSTREDGVIDCERILRKTAAGLKNDAVLNAALDANISIKGAQELSAAQGVDVSESTIKHVKEKRSFTPADIQSSFNDLEPFLDAYKALNPGTIFKVDRVGGEGGAQLERLLFIPHYTKSILDYIYDIIGNHSSDNIIYDV